MSNPSTDALLPCPFCGCEEVGSLKGSGVIACKSCCAEGPIGIDTAAEWNTRTTPRLANSEEMVERVAEIIYRAELDGVVDHEDIARAILAAITETDDG